MGASFSQREEKKEVLKPKYRKRRVFYRVGSTGWAQGGPYKLAKPEPAPWQPPQDQTHITPADINSLRPRTHGIAE